MKKRFNRNAICSSENYRASKQAHLDMLQERHSHFCGMVVSGEVTFDTPIIKDGKLLPKFKTIRVFGKEMQVTVEEYNVHCKTLGF